jgi:hypothetical protein
VAGVLEVCASSAVERIAWILQIWRRVGGRRTPVGILACWSFVGLVRCTSGVA